MPALTQEQLAARRKKIGGSECAVAIGMNPWCSPLQLFAEKMGITTREPNAAMNWGHYMEEVIALKYGDEHPSLVLTPSSTLTHGRHDWIIATPDRLCLDTREQTTGVTHLLQIKNVGPNSTDAWGEPGTDEIPDYVACQVQWEMGVVRSLNAANVQKTIVGACLGGRSPDWYEVAWDQEFFDLLVKANESFVTQFLVPEIAPPMDYTSEWSEAYLQKRHQHSSGDMLTATDHDKMLADVYRTANEQIRLAEEAKRSAKIRLEERIGDHDGITGDSFTATWRSQRGKVDWEAVATSLVGQVAQSIVEEHRALPHRVFRLK